VGCQNYDDQFDDLNAQISALKSQVDGLSSLSGQVSALSGTIAGLQSGVAAAQASADAANTAASGIDLSGLSASLATLQAEVDAVQASLATAATASAVAALQVELDALESDLDDLLVSNNVYSTGITINSAATMASALALGNKVALMNAAVDITDDATISDTDVQTFIDRIKTTTAGFRYDSGSATGYAPTFNEMVSATTFDIESAGDISATKLASATVVTIVDTYSTKVTSIDLGALASVTTIQSGTDGSETANNLTMANATNIDLGALTMYNVASASDALTISMKKGGTLDIGSLTGTERTTNLEEPLDLTVSGPASLNISKIADGTLTVSNVASLTVSGHYGTLDVNAGVETLTTTNTVTAALDGAVDVVTATLDFAYDYDPSLTTAQAAVADDLRNIGYLTDIAATGDWVATDLKTLTVTGELLDLYLDEANLETLSIDATMHDLTLNGTTDLTSLTVASGSKIGNILVTGANNLAVADFDHTTNLNNKISGTTAGTSSNSANKSVSFQVYDNTALTTVHSTGDDVSTLTIAGNDSMTSVDFTGLKDQGTATSATVVVYDNDLTAPTASNTSDGDTDRADGLATDLGAFDVGTSGMKTLATYLGNVDGDADNTVFVTFDTVASEVDTETSGTSTTTLNITGPTGYTTSAAVPTSTNQATVLAMTPATANTAAGAKDAIAARVGWHGAASAVVQFRTSEGSNIPTSAYTLTGNEAIDAAAIASTANKDLFSAIGVTLDAKATGYSYGTVSLISLGGTDTAIAGERYTTTAAVTAATTDTNGGDGLPVFSTSMSDTFTLAVGGNSVTVSLAGTYGGTQTVSTLAAIESAIQSAWTITYGKSGTASSSAIATILGTADGVIDIQMLQKDSGGHGKAVTFSVANASSATSETTANIDYVIGATKESGDNSTVATTNAAGLIISLTSNGVGDADNTSGIIDASTGASLTALSTDFTTNTAYNVNTYAHTTVERTDVRSAENPVAAATSNGVAAVLFTRVAWLS
jgi:hypothetical protein